MKAEQIVFIEEMGKTAQKYYDIYKILPSLTIAQAILESGWGKSELAQKAFNYFGMKAGTGWKGKVYTKETGEQKLNGDRYSITAKFRAYANREEGIRGYYIFLQYPRYAKLRGVTDYKMACMLIKEAGWATDISYTNKLIELIEKYNLSQYDIVATGIAEEKVKVGDNVKFKGGDVYTSSNAKEAAKEKGVSECKVTKVYDGAHPYHIISKDSEGVYGWVDANRVERKR